MLPTYLLTDSIDVSVIGEYPQIQEFSRIHNDNAQLYHYPDVTGRFPEDTELPIYRMQTKARLTDLVSNVPLTQQLMISGNGLSVFRKLNLPEFQIFPLKFLYKGKMIESYCSFSLVREPHYLERFISWKHSIFYITQNYHRIRLKELRFDSPESWKAKRMELEDTGEYGLLPVIKLNYNKDFDLFNFGHYPILYGFVCTERFVNAILDAKLTGFRFEPLPNDLFVSD